MDLLKGYVARSLFWRNERHCEAVCAAPGSAAAAVHIDVDRGWNLIVDHAAHALQNSTVTIMEYFNAKVQAQPLLYLEHRLQSTCMRTAHATSYNVCTAKAKLGGRHVL